MSAFSPEVSALLLRLEMTAEQVYSVVEARAADPFSILGLHRGAAGWRVCVFDPHADAVAVADGRALTPLHRLHPAGLWGGLVPHRQQDDRPFAYRLCLRDHSGREWEQDDAYRFGPWLGELDSHLLAEGTHLLAYQRLGAHPCHHRAIDGEDVAGVAFAVWAPNAARVSVVGDFNAWDGRRHPMRFRVECGVWEVFVPQISVGEAYKFELRARSGEVLPLKFDPYAFHAEVRPANAARVHGLTGYDWGDQTWLQQRAAQAGGLSAPMSIYEVHLGSWKRGSDGHRFLTYRELAEELVPYVRDLGFTHIELLPVHEHPFDGSWGYQPIGLYAPTSRFGTPSDFKAFVDACHRAGLGVIIDWVPGHFPKDAHGLGLFDGTHLYEHADPRQGEHMDWGTLIYNFGRSEVRNFLIANALYWIREFHIDGLRVDAVASMLYLNYSRREGEWVANQYGGCENLEAVNFLRKLNEAVYGEGSGAVTLAEESTSWPMVSRPTWLGGLGFGYKWNMGWMNDTLEFFKKDPVYRKYYQNHLTFAMMYAFSENFCLPLSHDEVVHGKGSLLGKMAGDWWQKFANLRAYFAFMWAHPGKKLLFMGAELAQEREWNFDQGLDWLLLDYPLHAGTSRLIATMNGIYRQTPALYEQDFEPQGFEWIDCHDAEQSVLLWLRRPRDAEAAPLIVACNLTPVVRHDYRVGLPEAGRYRVLLNTDALDFGGSGVEPLAEIVEAHPQPSHGRPWSLTMTLPPLATVWLQRL